MQQKVLVKKQFSNAKKWDNILTTSTASACPYKNLEANEFMHLRDYSFKTSEVRGGGGWILDNIGQRGGGGVKNRENLGRLK